MNSNAVTQLRDALSANQVFHTPIALRRHGGIGRLGERLEQERGKDESLHAVKKQIPFLD